MTVPIASAATPHDFDDVRPDRIRRPGVIYPRAVIAGYRLLDVIAPLATGYLWYRVYCTFEPSFWSIYGKFAVVAAVLANLIFQITGCYETKNLTNRLETIRTLLTGFFWLLVVGLTTGFFSKSLNDVSRVWILLWSVSWVAVAVGARHFAVRSVLTRVSEGGLLETVAVVGAGVWGERIYAQLLEQKRRGVRVIGVFDDRRDRVAPRFAGTVRPISDLLELGRRTKIDRVMLTLPLEAETRVLEISNYLMALSVDVVLCPDVSSLALLRRPVSSQSGFPAIQLINRPLSESHLIVKAIEDKIIASIVLLLIAPLLAAIAIAIKFDSRGPVLFRQLRHGYNNREFEVLKFRTMRVESGDATGGRQTQRNDSRVTRLGAFLRRTSLDELPQLFNVLRGDMSIVGPRPHPIGMRTQDLYCHEIVQQYAHRHRVRPGITGWAQINGARGATDVPAQLRKRVELDLYYIENWSLLLDLKILFLTGFRLFSEEAY